MNKQAVKQRIESLLQRFAQATSQAAYSSVIPQSMTTGKLYEAHVLSLVIEKLATEERYQVVLKNSSFLPLKSAPGPINRGYAYFELWRSGVLCAELWTDVEFISLSCAHRGKVSAPDKGGYHEVDIMVADPGLTGRPLYTQIWLAVECKNTGYGKSLLKEILGIRRELSLLQGPQTTRFERWPRTTVPADPASCLLVYSSDPVVADYSGPGEVFGIDFHHEPI